MKSLASGVSWWWVVAGIVLFPGIAAGITTVTLQRESEPTSTAFGTPTPTATPDSEDGSPEVRVRTAGLFDGMALSLEEYEARKSLPPIGILVDNHPNAYPQYGLDRAELVYEVLVEGGVTRFLALYWRGEAERIEPVASSAFALSALGQGHGTVFALSGGALAAESAGNVVVDALAHEAAFRRSVDHSFPHNITTSTTLIRAASSELGTLPSPTAPGWQFKDDGEVDATALEVDVIQVDFGGPDHTSAQWHWDSRAEMYARFQSGKPHLDGQTQQQLRFRNLVVLASPGNTAGFDGAAAVSGGGRAWIFVDGRMIEGSWKKEAGDRPLQIFGADGRAAALNRGSTWVAVFGPEGTVIAVPHEEVPPTVAVSRPTVFIPRDDPTQPPPRPPTQTASASTTASTTASPSTSPSASPSVTTPTPPTTSPPTRTPAPPPATPTLLPAPSATPTSPPVQPTTSP